MFIHLLGWLFMLSPLALAFILISKIDGWRVASAVFGGAACIVGLIFIGAHLAGLK